MLNSMPIAVDGWLEAHNLKLGIEFEGTPPEKLWRMVDFAGCRLAIRGDTSKRNWTFRPVGPIGVIWERPHTRLLGWSSKRQERIREDVVDRRLTIDNVHIRSSARTKEGHQGRGKIDKKLLRRALRRPDWFCETWDAWHAFSLGRNLEPPTSFGEAGGVEWRVLMFAQGDGDAYGVDRYLNRVHFPKRVEAT